MAERALLGMAPNEAMAHIYADRLRLAGLPVDVGQTLYPYPNAGAPVELWLADSALLDQPGVREQIDEVFHPPAEVELPTPDDEVEERSSVWLGVLKGLLALVVVAGLSVAIFAKGRTPEYSFLQGAPKMPMAPWVQQYLNDIRCEGYVYQVEGAYVDVTKMIRRGLSGTPLRESGIGEPFTMTHAHRDSYGWTIYEQISLMRPPPSENKTGRLYILWAYRPNLGEWVGHRLGR